jgi:uncharacterized membrane protein YfcA
VLLPLARIRHYCAMEAWIVIFVLAVVFAATVAQTVAGIGFALVAVPLFVTVLDVRDAIVLTTLVGAINNTILARTSWRHVPWPTVGPMLAGAIAGMPAGLAVLLLAPPDAIRISVGVATLVMAAAVALGLRFRNASNAAEFGVGAVSGVLNTSVGINGPPVVLYLQGREHAPHEFRGALAVFFFACNVITLAIFAASMIVTREALGLWLAAVPGVAVGSVLGHRLIRAIEPVAFRRLVFAMLVASALSAIGTSLARLAA